MTDDEFKSRISKIHLDTFKAMRDLFPESFAGMVISIKLNNPNDDENEMLVMPSVQGDEQTVAILANSLRGALTTLVKGDDRKRDEMKSHLDKVQDIIKNHKPDPNDTTREDM